MDKVFEPNLTTKLIVKTLLELDISAQSKFLDLGCGNGIIGREVVRGSTLSRAYGSDISKLSIVEAELLAKKEGVYGTYRVGSGLRPWVDEKFDIISCDIAAISESIAEVSDWYEGVSCDTGPDGLRLVGPIISEVSEYLSDDGIFVIPIISLADHKSLVKKLNENFSQVIIRNRKEWPFPSKIIAEMETKKLAFSTKNWFIFTKFGMNCAFTSVAVCSKNNN